MFLLAAAVVALAAAVNGQLTSECGGSVTITSGEALLVSPNYPYAYYHNQFCNWQFNAPTGRVLRFEARAFSTEANLDTLTIGSQTFSGQNNGTLNVTAGASASVSFRSDASVSYTGFLIVVTAILPPPDPNCGGTVYVQEGRTSYFGLTSYRDNQVCEWTITAAPTKNIVFNTVRFDTESTHDRLAFIVGTQTIGTFSGTSGPSRLRSGTNQVIARFTSDSSVVRTGFNISAAIDFCPAGQNPCPNHPTTCIASNQYCDGVQNCPDNIDEQFCNAECGRPAVQPDLTLGAKDGKIVGGAEAIPHSWPWQFAFTSASGSQFCGGSLLSARWAMSAAHCCEGNSASGVRVLLGAHYLAGTEGAISAEVSRIVMHPQYGSPRQFSNDFCLLELAQPVPFGPHIIPVCLANDQDAPPGSHVWVTGWGRTGRMAQLSDQEYANLVEQMEEGTLDKNTEQEIRDNRVNELRQVRVNVTTQEYCSAAYPNQIDDSMICAAAPSKDSCQGDSGGPFVNQRPDGSWALSGVVSWGRGCALPQYPGVYGRISSVLDWITETMYSK